MGKFNKSDLSVTVSATLGDDYEEGQVLTKAMDIAEYFRQSVVAGGVEDFNMDDDAIVAIVKSVPYYDSEPKVEHGSPDWENDVCSTLESRNKSNSDRTAPLVDMTSAAALLVTSGSIAATEGEDLDKDDAFRLEMHTAAKAST